MSRLLVLLLSFDTLSWPAVLAETAYKGVIVLALAGLLTLGLRKESAAARHVVWSIALTILLIQPALFRLLPGWKLPILSGTAQLALPAPALAPPPVTAAHPRAPELSAERSFAATRARPSAPEVAVPQGRTKDPRWLIWVWLTGATVLGLRLANGVMRIRRLLREARPLDEVTWSEEVRALCRSLHIARQVRLLAVPCELMPMTWGVFRPVIVLPAVARDWPAERRRVVLLHELAHIRRWDCLTQAIAQVACALHWLNPLAWLAAGRLLAEREHACDRQVLLCGTRPSEYAAHLLEIARTFHSRSAFYPASAAAVGRRSRLESRVRAILSFSGEGGAPRLRLLLAAGLAVALSLPVVWLRPEAAANAASPTGVSAQEAARSEAEEPPTGEEQRGELRVIWGKSPARYEVTGRGAVELTADERGVAQLARDGYLKILAQRLRGGDLPPVTVRTLSIREQGGGLVYEQTVAGQPKPFDAESQQWLAGLLPELVAETGFGASTRVAHLLQAGGVDRAFAEIAQLKNPRVRRVFLNEVLQSGLSSSDLRKVVRFAGRELPPDGDLGRFLYPAAHLYLGDPQDRAAFLAAAAAIRSEDEYARFMASLLKSQHLAAEVESELIRSASSRIATDETRAGFLSAITELALAQEELRPVYFETLKAVRAEDTLARLAVALLGREGLETDLRRHLFETAFNGMVSDETKAGFLLQVGEQCLADPTLREPYLTAAKSIREDRPRAAVRKLLQERGEL